MNRLQKQRERYLDNLEKGFERELIRNYQASLKELRGQLAEIYAKHDGSWVEMQKYNRLAKLEEQIAMEIGKLTGKNAMTLSKSQRHVFEESYYYTGYILSKEVKSNLHYTALNHDLIKRSIENPLDRVGFLERNRANQHTLVRQLKDQLTQGLILGESYRKTAKRIKDRMDVGASKALRIARTENHRVRSLAILDSMEHAQEMGLKVKKMWVSAIDGRTRDTHQDLDGVVVDIDDEFITEDGSAQAPGMFGLPEEDINCRCTMIEVVEGFEPTKRRVRDAGLVDYATYNDFKQKLG